MTVTRAAAEPGANRPEAPVPVHVGIVTWSVDSSKGGIKTYLLGMITGLQSVPGVTLTLICRSSNASLFEPLRRPADRLVIIDLPGPQIARPLTEQLCAWRLRRTSVDVLLVPSNVGLALARLPQVVVVQAPLAVPRIRQLSGNLITLGLGHRLYYRTGFAINRWMNYRVVSVTQWMKKQLEASYPRWDRGRLAVVLEGCTVGPPPPAVRTESPVRLLFVSTLFPYKGAELLVEALGALGPERHWTCSFVGRDPAGGSTVDRLRGRADQLGIGDQVSFLGPLAHTQVLERYETADVFVYPSQLESFGLPPLEAMSLGTPVIASSTGSVAEVVGGAAIVVDPADPLALREALTRLIDSAEARQELSTAGWRRASELSWQSAGMAMARELRREADRRDSTL